MNSVMPEKTKISHQIVSLLVVVCSFSSLADEKFSWDGELAIGSGYDSNVTVDEIDLNARTGDHFFKYEGKLGFDYDMSDSQTTRMSFKVSEKRYNDVEQLDTWNQFFSMGYTYRVGKVNYGIDFRHIDSELNGQDFLTLKMYSPFVSGFLAKKHYVRFGMNHIEKNLKARPLRDATSNEYSADYYYFINGLNNFFILSAKYKNENAEDLVFSYDSVQLRAAYERRFELFTLPTKARLDIRVRERRYDEEINPQISEFRQDTRKRLGLSLDSEISSRLTVFAEAAYVDNDSDLSTLQYHESLFTLTLKYEF